MQKEMEKRPNILLITTDTQRVDTLRCMGYPEAVSPNLDRLAEEGILFERAYTAAPACMPARCCLMTGLYSPLHGCIENGIERQEQLPMLTDELKKLGYKTAALALTDDSVGIDDSELMKEEKLAVILGNEGEGLESETIALCDYTVKIPMTHGVDSLNVAAASAVAFWQLGKIIL